MVHNEPMRLVLASASPARRATLIAAGITPLVRVSTVDEDAVLDALPGDMLQKDALIEQFEQVRDF